MTCIIGIIEKGKVFIGGDSAGVSGLDVTIRRDQKVFKVGDFVFGCTTSFRMIQLLQFSFNPPKRHEDTDIFQYMCTSFVDAMRDCFRKGGWLESEKGIDKGGTFLVAYRDRLFCIMNDLQVSESVDLYAAVGCGEDYAKGALAATDINLPAADRIRIALEVATKFSAGVRPPYNTEST